MSDDVADADVPRDADDNGDRDTDVDSDTDAVDEDSPDVADGLDGSPDAAAGDDDDADSSAADPLVGLADREGWQVEGYAARVHYRGETDRYSVEYYAPSDCVLYWKVKGDGETAVPVGRDTVPGPLRERVCRDLAAAGVDVDVEDRRL